MKIAPAFRHHRIAFIVMLLSAVAPHGVAAQHDEYRGTDLAVHYVHLSGHGGDPEVDRKLLAEEHQACFELHKQLGRAAAPLPSEGIPEVPRPMNVEIYYSADRTLTIKRGKTHFINKDNCALTVRPHHNKEIRSAVGRCDIDMLKKEARGICGAAAERSRPAGVRAAPMHKSLPPGMEPAKVGGKSIAGIHCDIYLRSNIGYEFCVANPKSSFNIPAAPFNGGLPGLLLEARNPAMTLKAQEVILELGVSKRLFSLPPGTKSVSHLGSKS